MKVKTYMVLDKDISSPVHGLLLKDRTDGRSSLVLMLIKSFTFHFVLGTFFTAQ